MGTEAAEPGNYYEVFLSFRGADTRKTFTNYLFHYLNTRGVKTFMDERSLRTGQALETSLPKAIGESRIWIVILSKHYASSDWCLKELAEIVECSKKDKDKVIMPIFYDVTPSDVRNQEGTFKGAFKGVESETLDKWRAALKHVAGLSGKERDKTADGKEGELALLIVNDVLRELGKGQQDMPGHLVGMEPHLEEVEKLLDISDNKPRTVGIHGMCGIGKTTISKAVYNKLLRDYECHCFLENIRQSKRQPGGVLELKKQLLKEGVCWKDDMHHISVADIRRGFHEKKALIVLDDVEMLDDLGVTCECLGPGSRIIVTTRDKHILAEVPCYEPPQMDLEKSVELLTKYVFKDDTVPEMWRNISEKVAKIASGLPLSLEMMGEVFLRLKLKPSSWDDTRRMLEEKPVKKVRERLEAMYKELEPEQRQIFLDVACLLIREDERIACHMWEARGVIPGHNLEELKSRFSLVKIENDNELSMHRQLIDFGKYFVRVGPESANDNDRAKGSRLWSHDEALKTLTRNSGQENDRVLALCLNFPSEVGEQSLKDASFENLHKLCFLRLDRAKLDGNTKSPLCDLKWLCWKVPSPELTLTNFCLDELVILDLSNSSISQDWKGWHQLKKAPLRVLNLTGCDCLEQTPDLSSFKDLERLILEDCKNLLQISISSLGKLIYLNLKNCGKLRLQSEDLRSLETVKEKILVGTKIIEELSKLSEGCRQKRSAIDRKNSPRGELGLEEFPEEIILVGTTIEELPKWSEMVGEAVERKDKRPRIK